MCEAIWPTTGRLPEGDDLHSYLHVAVVGFCLWCNLAYTLNTFPLTFMQLVKLHKFCIYADCTCRSLHHYALPFLLCMRNLGNGKLL